MTEGKEVGRGENKNKSKNRMAEVQQVLTVKRCVGEMGNEKQK